MLQSLSHERQTYVETPMYKKTAPDTHAVSNQLLQSSSHLCWGSVRFVCNICCFPSSKQHRALVNIHYTHSGTVCTKISTQLDEKHKWNRKGCMTIFSSRSRINCPCLTDTWHVHQPIIDRCTKCIIQTRSVSVSVFLVLHLSSSLISMKGSVAQQHSSTVVRMPDSQSRGLGFA